MRFLKRVIQWTIGIICGLYLSLQIALHIPFVQELAGSSVASVLKNAWGWDISIGQIKLGLWNRIIIDDICIKDKQDSTMLHASRLAAKIDLLPLSEGRISIANAQLFGTQANLYQRTPEERPNFQFIIDTFKSEDSTSNPINLHIGSILLRRVNVKWTQEWKEPKAQDVFDPSHLFLQDIAVTAHLKVLTEDSINLNLKRLSLKDKSGLNLKNASFQLVSNKSKSEIKDFKIQLPNSTISIPSFTAVWPSDSVKLGSNRWIQETFWKTDGEIKVTPSDFNTIYPQLRLANIPISAKFQAFGSEDCINVPSMTVSNQGSLDLDARIFIQSFVDNPKCTIEILKFQTNSRLQQYISGQFLEKEQEISPIITRLDTINISGRLEGNKYNQSCDIKIRNHTGNFNLSIDAKQFNTFVASVTSDGIKLNDLLSDNGKHILGKTSFDLIATGSLKSKQGKPHINTSILFPQILLQGREYNDTELKAEFNNGILSIEGSVKNDEGHISFNACWNKYNKNHSKGTISIDNFPSEQLGLGERYPNTRLSMNTEMDLRGSNIDNLIGSVSINNFIMETTDNGTPIAGPLNVSINTEIDYRKNRTLNLTSEQINLYAQGNFRFSTLARTIQNSIHKKLSNIIPGNQLAHKADTIHFKLDVQDTTILKRIALKDISIPTRANISGDIYGYDSLYVNANIPYLKLGKERLKNSHLTIKSTPRRITSDITTERLQKNDFVDMSLNVNAYDNTLRVIAKLDEKQVSEISGEIDIVTRFQKTSEGKKLINALVTPTEFVISDTIWQIYQSNISWDTQRLDIKGLKISQSPNRGIEVNGRISANNEDTVRLNLNNINVEYILNLVNFNSVEFSGFATGTATATGLLSHPKAYANLQVKNFCFNDAPLGTLFAEANWGETPSILALDATISDPPNNHYSSIQGGFNIGKKDIGDGLDLKVNTRGFNLAFMNKFTKDILENFQGRATGYCRVYGPFKAIDLEGDLVIDHADCKLPMLGTTYHIHKDSVHLRPGEISIKALLSDDYANKGKRKANNSSKNRNDNPHTAYLNGKLMHKHFKDLSYSFDVKANKFLGYDFKEFGENSFYATCIASGDISVKGGTGQLVVDINAMPEAGTTFTYNVSTPEALTEAGFINIKSGEANDTSNIVSNKNISSVENNSSADITKGNASENETESDLFINFNLAVTPSAKMRLLMDRKSGDMIELMGEGRITAKFHNKGRFNIYGTYKTHDGHYRLSIQDIVRREFRFQPGGTIAFGGNPMQADLNLKAVYSVHGVSLDDLTTSSLGFSKTRVNCIMNLTGHPEQPAVTFDFELPDATEDEQQMVRSIVSTDEERNMQAIYLLGLGRFVNFETENNYNSSNAVNSLVSSTLSSQLNQFISDAIGTSTWSFGTNLKTGDDGWRNMDVEGMLNGSLFDNRLLVSGNFGYREKYYTQRNFISDVSIEYLLTPNGTISLKAYNQANDRYFVQSSLNTQGIGIQFKKDFNRFSNLFMWLLPKKSREAKEAATESK